MKRFNFVIMAVLVLALVLAFVACDNGTTGGSDGGGDPVLPGSVTISPTSGVEVGDTLTANFTGGPGGVTVSYQWKRGATNVGTNSATYVTQVTGSHTVTVSAPGYTGIISNAVTVAVAGGGGGGEGTAENPFEVYDVTTLGYVGRGTANPAGYKTWTRTAHYKQTADITLPVPAEGQGNWTAIGDEDQRFTGTYNGNGYEIIGLVFSATSSGYRGLFGYTGTGSVVKNLGLADCSIKGNVTVGCIAANVSGGTIENCYSTGEISATDEYTGGITGLSFNNGIIKNCYSSVSIEGSSRSGGIAGENRGTIQDCYFTGSVQGSSSSNYGGIAGYSSGTVQNCYVKGTVNGRENVGGIVGYNNMTGAAGSGVIKNCYSTGEISGAYMYFGGVAGYNNKGTIQNCYSTSMINGQFASGGLVGCNEDGTVRNCYATGDVIISTGSSGDAGGLAGLNSGNNSLLEYCYATGSVYNRHNYTGGVAGHSGNLSGSRIQNCVALNDSVTQDSTETLPAIGRVCGGNLNGIENNNYGRLDMTVTHYGEGTSGKPISGDDVTTTQAVTASWWTTAGNWYNAEWDTAIWNIADGKLPTLQNMPEGEQNPEIQ